MKYQPLNTLAYYDTAPHLSLVNVGAVEVPTAAINCQKYLVGVTTPSPERYAVSFYAMNHLVMLVRSRFTKHESLPEWAVRVMEKYNEVLADQGRRMMTYLMLITTREARHASMTSELKVAFAKQFGQALVDFLNYTKGNGSGEAVEKWLKHPPKLALSPYFNGVEQVFLQAKFGGGYGGKPWANIAKTLAAFIDGKTSMEMMVDTAYTLAHNGGPIFNKGMCFGHYTGEIYKILDVQRSGQMIEYVKTSGNYQLIDAEVKSLACDVSAMFPDEFGTEIDWYKVEDLGAVHKYPNEKKAQKKQPAKVAKKPAKTFDEILMGAAKDEAPTPYDAGYEEPVKAVKTLKIIGTQSVQIVERAK